MLYSKGREERNVDTITDDTVDIEIAVNTTIQEMFVKLMWKTKSVMTVLVWIDTPKYANTG